MPIPEFDDNVLPEGVHECTVAEVEARFGRFRKSDRRIKLTDRLKQYLTAAKQSGIVTAVIVNGSYVMNVDEPEDIDLIAILSPDFDQAQELKPYQENVVDRSAIYRDYRFDGFVYKEGSLGLHKLIIDFGVVPEKHEKVTAKSRKGMVRVNL
jgi:hypothetical protein